MPQLVILSGKGGTGKTCLSAAFAHLSSVDHSAQKIVLVDADVDAANLELILKAKRFSQEVFSGGETAQIDRVKCNSCGMCQVVCRFGAVACLDGNYEIDPIACDGCASCLYQCPQDAICMKQQIAGEWFCSETDYGSLFHAHLYPAQNNSGKLVALIKQKAQQVVDAGLAQLMLVDGPPGIGCPVISAVSGADHVLIVTEPSLAGIHDLERVLAATAYFGIQPKVCINKADLFSEGADRIQKLCLTMGVELIGRIPFDLSIPRAMTQGMPVTRLFPDSPASKAIVKIWANIKKIIKEDRVPGNLVKIKS